MSATCILGRWFCPINIFLTEKINLTIAVVPIALLCLKAAPYRTELHEKNMGLIRFNGKFGAKGTGILNVQLKQLKIHLSLLSANAIKIMKL